jgi:hypothetical protein
MTTAEWITASVVFIIAAILAVVSIRSFLNKGFLFNNAYIYASKEERCILRQRTATNARPNGRRARGQRPRCAKLTATVSGLYFLPT